MNRWQLVRRSLTHHWRINLAVALGVAAATAVLTGALLVGDSVRGSLRSLTLDRLGRIDEVLVSDRFFGLKTVNRMRESAEFQRYFDAATPTILFPLATIESRVEDRDALASDGLVIGCDDAFWDLDATGVRPSQMPGPGQVVINQTVADDLRAKVGDQITLRLPKGNQVPADSPLASKTDRVRSIPQLEVVAIVPARGLGRFRLRPSQSLPRNIFLPIETLQNALDQPGRANAVMVALKPGIDVASDEANRASEVLNAAFKPSFEDYGLQIHRVTVKFPVTGDKFPVTGENADDAPTGDVPTDDAPGDAATDADSEADTPESGPENVVFDYFSITTDRMILSPAAEDLARRAFAPYDGQPLFTYLANSITREGETEGIPYSTITAIDFSPAFNPLDLSGDPIGKLADNEIVLNSWAADDQRAKPGDRFEVAFFSPETTHGEAVEERAEFTLKAVTPLTEPARPYSRRRVAEFDKRPTLVNDPDLTPEVEGVTDRETIDDWDPPFPFDRGLILGPDDDYWMNYRTTPKAFISFAAGKRLWGSRFGDATAFRVPYRPGLTVERLREAFLDELQASGENLGLEFIPVKRQQLAASRGTTPFDGLFLGLSFFIIAAALLLVALLFRLGVEQRADEIGILLASGFRRWAVGALLSFEGAVVAAVGALLGVGVGIGYAWLMISGLRTWWVGAITTPFLDFHWSAQSLLLGYSLGVLVSVLTILVSVWQLRRTAIRRLLAGVVSDSGGTYQRQTWVFLVAIVCIFSALGLLALATRLGGIMQACAFVGGGALVLTGLMLAIWGWLKSGGASRTAQSTGSFALLGLALRSAARNPSRSTITVGLMATASFLIIAMSAFRLAPTDAGTGGFDLVAQSAQPIFANLNTQQGRLEVMDDESELLKGGNVFGLRLRAGDDASCNNLYQATQPRVIGMTPEFIAHFDNPQVPSFAWFGSAAKTAEDRANPWRLLSAESGSGDSPSGTDEPIPVVIDMNTAMYSLKPPQMVGSIYEASYDDGPPIRFRVVGLLENSVLQGGLIISEKDFERQFPNVGGYRYFLIESPPGNSEEVAAILESRLSDQGFDAVPTKRLLEQLMAVQNTYLSTFQSLGALGLLLGTFGLATVQLRNVAERRGELALLQAAGFRRSQLGLLVLWENLVLLTAGLVTGAIAASLAVLPHKLDGNALVPTQLLFDLGTMLVVVLLVGILTGLAAVRAALRTPVLTALRGN